MLTLPRCGLGVRGVPCNVGPVKHFDTDTMERRELQTGLKLTDIRGH